MRRFEFSEGTSNKFWEAEVSGTTLSVRWGRIGTAGQGKDKAFTSADKAQAEHDKLVREKVKEGYREVGAVPARPAPAPVAVLEKPPPQGVVQAAGSDGSETVVWTPAGRAGSPVRRPRDLRTLPLAERTERFRQAVSDLLSRTTRDARQAVVATPPGVAPSTVAAVRHLVALLRGSSDLPDLDVEALAAQAAMLELADYQSWRPLPSRRNSDFKPARMEFVYFWAQVASPATALRAVAGAWSLKREGRVGSPPEWWVVPRAEVTSTLFLAGDLGPWDALRRVLAACDDGAWAEAVTWAEKARPGAPLALRVAIDYLFPERPEWARDDLQGCLKDVPIYAGWLLTCLDPPAARDLLAAIANRHAHHLQRFAWDALAALGAACAPILMEHFGDEVVKVLACIRTPEVAAFFAAAPGGKAERDVGYEYLLSLPYLSVPALLPLAHQEEQKRLLNAVVSHHPEVADRLPLTPEQCAVLTALQPKMRDLSEASPDVLPEVLRNPPWLRRPKPRPAPIKGLTPPPWLERVVLDDGDLEAVKGPIRVHRHGEQLDAKVLGDDVLLDSLETQWPYGPLHLYCLQRLRMRAVPALVSHIEKRSHFAARAWELLTRVDSLSVCPLMVEAYARLKRYRKVGALWLSRFPETAAVGAIPVAVGTTGPARQQAVVALQFIAKTHLDVVLQAADSYGPDTRAAVDMVLAEDPLDACPDRMPKLPDTWWTPVAWHRPLLRDRQTGLPASVLDTIGLMLAISVETRYAGLDQVRAACDPDSLDAFVWDLFSAWLAANAPAKEQWALLAVGHLGGDESARRLTPLIREWPGQSASARAFLGLDVLALIGTDVALMHLHGIAQKVKFKGLQDKAQEKIAEIAEARNLSPEELADRLVPDLGLDASGTTWLDFGPRRFRVGFDEALKPYVTESDGKRLPDLPKPGKADDQDKAGQATERWKNLKKDVRTMASDQILRLELACCAQRRWAAETFRTFFVQHPLVFHLATRLVWGVFDSGNRLTATFRVAEDRTLASVDDDPFDLPATSAVGLPHPLEAPTELFARWAQVCGDYEILQPFQQLGRPTYIATDQERRATSLARAAGFTVPFGKVLGLEKRGWRRGEVQDGGVSDEMVKRLPDNREAILELDPGLIAGMVAESGDQTLNGLRVRPAGTWEKGTHLGVLSPVTFSELVADIMSLKN